MPATKEGRVPPSHYTRRWKAKPVIRTLLNQQSENQNEVSARLRRRFQSLRGGQAWHFLCYAGECHSNDGVTLARFTDG